MTTMRQALRRGPRDSYWLVLGILLIAALALRLYGIDWDDGADLHPDEMFIAKIVLIDRIHMEWPPNLADLLDPATSGLNPRSVDPLTGQYREFPYGALPLLVTDGVAAVLSKLSGVNWNAPERAYLVGRFISALLSALTILPIAAIGRAYGGRSLGVLAASFAAIAPMSLQLAHFFTTDSWLSFFVALCLWACTRILAGGGGKAAAVAGCTYGLALACKGSVFTLALPIAVAIGIAAWQKAASTPLREVLVEFFRNGAGAAAATLVAFALFEPYAIAQPAIYLQSLRTQADIVSGSFDVPFTRVYVGSVPVLYQLEQLVRWGYGPVAGLLCLLGLARMAVNGRRGSPLAIMLLSWVAVYAGVLIVAEAKFLRYLEPLTPVLAVAAGVGVLWVRQSLGDRQWRVASRAIVPVAFAAALIWTGAFVSIYAHENPRVAATKWIFANIPPGSTLTAEYWDDSLPRSLNFPLSPAAFGLGTISLDLYRDLPPQQVAASLHDELRNADYVVQSSHRVEDAIDAAPWRYPAQQRFYELLADGTLGFSPVASFTRFPTFGPLQFNDRHADESFINYDHPEVTIYRKASELSPRVWRDLFAWAEQRPWQPSRHQLEPTLQLPGPVGENLSVSDARWSAALTSNTLAALAVWVVLLVVLAVVGFPLASIAFQAFPDVGWGLSRTIGLSVAAYLVWIGASLQLFRFRAIWVLAALAIVGLCGWLANTWLRRRGLPGGWRPAPRSMLHAEFAFWLIFALFLFFRLILPDGWHPIWGGEKPMEFALINSIGRSAYFPPYDPWFADGYVNYYYYGFYLMSFLMKSVGAPSELGFNLALPTVMGLLASGGFSLGAALVSKLTRTPRLAVLGGWATVATICVVSNLSALRGLLTTRPASFDPFLFWTWGGSRVIDYAINEFPYFSGLYADLHAHVVALPLTVAIIALCLALVNSRFPDRGSSWGHYVPTAVRLLLIALLLGSLGATNAWDVPMYALLSLASWFMASAAISQLRPRALAFFAGAAMIALGAWLLFLPFHQHFVALFSKVALVHDPTDLMQFLTHFGAFLLVCSFGLATLLLPVTYAPRVGWVWACGAILALSLGVAISVAGNSATTISIGNVLILGSLVSLPVAAAALLARQRMASASRMASSSLIVLGGAVALGLGMLLLGRSVLGLLLPLAGAAIAGWLTCKRPAERFVCLLAAAAFCTSAGVELIVVADDLIDSPFYRMNTVFKFYNQVWILLAVVSAALLVLMVRDLARWRLQVFRGQAALPAGLAPVGAVVSSIALLATLTYPLLATVPRLEQRFTPGTPRGSLNALGWMQEGTVPVLADNGPSEIQYRGDAAVIDWLWRNVRGTPVIAEASIGPYRCNGSRISAATGLPTIIGWERHEQQQRYPDSLPGRVADVRTLYTSPDPETKAEILYRYNVAYVVVSDLERIYPTANNECTPSGSDAGMAAFDAMVGKELEVAFSSDGATLYRVLPPGEAS